MFNRPQSIKCAIQIVSYLGYRNDFTTSSEIIRSITHSDPDRLTIRSKAHNSCLSPTYIDKILSNMVKLDILSSSWSGFKLKKPYEAITVKDILNLCQSFKTNYNPFNSAVDMILSASEGIKVKDLH